MALPIVSEERGAALPTAEGRAMVPASSFKDQTARPIQCAGKGDVAAARIDESCIAHAEGHWDGEGDGGVVGDDVVGQDGVKSADRKGADGGREIQSRPQK